MGLVAFSFLTTLISVILSALLPQFWQLIYYGCLIWTAVIIGIGIQSLRVVTFLNGFVTGVIAVLLVSFVADYFYSFAFNMMM
jgi:hypothetical protein